MFSHSGVPSGVLKAPTPLTQPEAEELKRQWNLARAGTRSTAVLSGGMEYEPVELSPSDIGWLDTRSSNAQEVARIFQIPPDLLGIAIQGGTGSITYKNLAEVGADFVQYCLSPYITIIEQAWRALRGQPPINFDTTPLYKESLETRARTLAMLVQQADADPQAAAIECGFSPTLMPAGESPATPRALAEMVQKIYLGVGVVLTAEEARQILNDAGASLDPNMEVPVGTSGI